ncbi:hypothetical protein [Uliginosibacterium gangwonense]|uniref:hypothetical protein n=1 Tax=Uliginosibacterium gangwonense TaxID=392736 RepID=UPI00039A0DE9|nr:hypothetical protein [Uliginosibacterium gangwonense]
MPNAINSQVFEFRSNPSIFDEAKQKRILWCLVTLAVVVLIVLYFGAEKEPGIGAWVAWRDSCLRNPILLVVVLQAVICFLTIKIQALQRRSSLVIDADALTHRCDVPRVLKPFLRWNWRIPLREIVAVEIVPQPVQAHITSLETAFLRIQTRERLPRMLTPASWHVLGYPIRVELIPARKIGPFSSSQTLWTLPENQCILREALNGLPLVRALRERGISVVDKISTTDAISQDMLAHRAVKFALTVGLLLVTSSLLLMMWRANQHLQMSFSIWVYAGLVAAALAVMGLFSWQETKCAPIAHSVAAMFILCVGISMAFQPLILFANGFLYDMEQTQAFVAEAGVLKPVGAQSGIGRIELPGFQSRIAWLKDGTHLQLTVKQGRLGLWEYDDAPLRVAADAQGIR